jgi:hypothetical protein
MEFVIESAFGMTKMPMHVTIFFVAPLPIAPRSRSIFRSFLNEGTNAKQHKLRL